MATKVYSPTTNLFALLADESSNQSSQGTPGKKTKPTNTKSPQQELTPKARAEAKAKVEAERRAKREALKQKQALEAEQKKAFDLLDDTGFSKQKNQRVKDNRKVEVPAPTKQHGKYNADKGEKSKGDKASWGGEGDRTQSRKNNDKVQGDKPKYDKPYYNKGQNKEVGDRPRNFDKPQGDKPKGDKPYNKGQNADRPNRGREFDKHSQGVTGRKPVPKKQGHGSDNWGTPVPENVVNANVDDALSAAVEDTTVTSGDGWGDDTTPIGTEETQPTETQETEGADAEETEPEVVEKTWNEYLELKEQKKKELEALIGASAQPRQLSEDERRAVGKFTLVENTKGKKVVVNKPAHEKPAQEKPKALNAGARKGEKAVAADDVLNFQLPRVAGRGRYGDRDNNNRREGQGPRKEFAGRGNNQNSGNKPNGGNNPKRGGQGGRANNTPKLPTQKDDTAFEKTFPSLG